MIRRRDQLRLSVQKIGLRKKRAAFSIISVALGVVIVVSANSLFRGIRELVIRTGYSEEIDKDVVRVSSNRQKRHKFLTDELLAQIRSWKEVEAAAPAISVEPLSVDALADSPRASGRTGASGVPEALLRRYADPKEFTATGNAIPLVIGERFVKVRYNEKAKKFDRVSPSEEKAWLGREVTLRVGDPLAYEARFRYDREKKQWLRLSEEELAQQRKQFESESAGQDKMFRSRTLLLRGRIVGFCPGGRVLMPEEPARLCAKWIKDRDALAQGNRVEEPIEYDKFGRLTPREGEYAEGLVLAKPGTDTEALAKRLREMGFEATTRQSAFESFLKEVDTAMKIVKRIVYAFGGVLLFIAGGLLWSTTSRIVSDSRVDIGLFRALGATKGDVRRLFLSETILLGELGTLAGMVLGWTAAYWISRVVIHFANREVTDPEEALMIPTTIFAVDWSFCALLLLSAGIVSLLAGLWPANRAANIDPVKALKRE